MQEVWYAWKHCCWCPVQTEKQQTGGDNAIIYYRLSRELSIVQQALAQVAIPLM